MGRRCLGRGLLAVLAENIQWGYIWRRILAYLARVRGEGLARAHRGRRSRDVSCQVTERMGG